MFFTQTITPLMIGLSIVTGAVQCFFGYRLFKVILGITGFLVFGALASHLSFAFSQQEWIALLAGISGGVFGALLLVMLYFVGVFFMGTLLGGVLGAVLYGLIASQPSFAVLLILALTGGICALVFQKAMIILSTAFSGAWYSVAGIATWLIGSSFPIRIDHLFEMSGYQLYVLVFGWFVLSITGVVFQYTQISKTGQPFNRFEMPR